MTTTQAWAGYITKFDQTPAGLMVYGKATGPDLDLDGQIADPKWLKTAMPEWMAWGNVREMHRPSAAGVGKELSEAGDDWNLKALVVDDQAARKVVEGVYKGFSIGINGPKVVRDAAAPGGRIVGGTVVEVSLVDRPCNPTATMGIAKAHGGVLAPVEYAGEVIGKAVDPDDADDDALAADAAAKAAKDAAPADPDDDLPIFGVVAKGVPAAEPAAPAAVAILSPSAWRKATATVSAVLAGTLTKRTVDESADIAAAKAILAQLAALIISEATELAAGRMDELADIACLMDACRAVKYFIACETRQDGTTADDPEDGAPVGENSMAYVGLAAGADAGKRDFSQGQRDDAADSGAAMPDGRYPILTRADLANAIRLAGSGKGSKAKIRAHIVARARALGASDMIPGDWAPKVATADATKATADPDTISTLIDDAVTKATAASEGRIKALEADLAKVLATPVRGGPFILPAAAATALAPADDRSLRARSFALQADHATDPAVAHAYRAAAAAHLDPK